MAKRVQCGRWISEVHPTETIRREACKLEPNHRGPCCGFLVGMSQRPVLGLENVQVINWGAEVVMSNPADVTHIDVLIRRCERACRIIRESGRWDVASTVAIRFAEWVARQ